MLVTALLMLVPSALPPLPMHVGQVRHVGHVGQVDADVPPTAKTEQSQQEPAPSAKTKKNKQEPPQRTDREWRAWWEKLSDQEKHDFRKRMDRFRDLDPEAQAEMQRRAERIQKEAEAALAQLPEEERKRIEALPPHEQRRAIQRLMRKHFDERSKDFRQRSPQDWQRYRQLPLDERLAIARSNYSERRLSYGIEKLNAYVEEGWLGKVAVEQLVKSGSADRMWAQIELVRVWKKLQELDQTGFWTKNQIPPKDRARIEQLAPREFFQKMREFMIQGLLPRPERRGWQGRNGRRGPGHGPPPEGKEGAVPPPPPGGGPPPERERSGGGRRGGGWRR